MYYNSIHKCPMKAFKKGLKGDYSAMSNSIFSSQKGREKAFESVFDEADRLFNLSEIYKEYLRMRISSCKLYAKALKGKRHFFTLARIKEVEAEKLLVGGTDEDLVISCAKLTRKMGIPVSPETITVAQYYSYRDV